MFRLLSGGVRIILFGLCGLGYLASLYPWQTGVGTLILVACYVHGVRLQRQKALGMDLRTMSPIDYERHCAEVLRSAGWSVKHVGRTGDQGVDVVAELRGVRVAIQCKRYLGARAGNSSVQQAVAGRAMYRAQACAVVASSGFTSQAAALAKNNGCVLLHHSQLPSLASSLGVSPN